MISMRLQIPLRRTTYSLHTERGLNIHIHITPYVVLRSPSHEASAPSAPRRPAERVCSLP